MFKITLLSLTGLLLVLAAVGWGDTLVPPPPTDTAASTGSSLVYIMEINGPIVSVITDRVIEAVEKAERDHADLLIITMDTPGGLNDALWPITKSIMNSIVPVAVYVSPVGARAASAGVYMVYAAHIAAMAPGTNIGAAHVVSASGEKIDSILSVKIMNDAVAALKAMAERNGRNAEWAEDAARKSVSITSTEALSKNVINFVAADVDDLIKKANGIEVNTTLGKKKMNLVNPIKRPIKRTFIQSLLEIISSPNVAFILFSLGGLGLVMELYNPGSILPGVVGGICIILAFYSFRTLPINYAGLLLIIFAILLFILEIKIVSHGILTIGGVVSLIIGGMMLVDTVDPSLRISKSVIFAVALVVGGFVAIAFTLALKARAAKPTTGVEGLLGQTGVVKSKIDKTGYVYVAGELWEASADEPIDEGVEVTVIEVKDLKIKVERKS
ncbi:MAG: nodulation protein NfeD [candidate division Zixibacteria bacterium]|nr:nodulation protein NfeD [candidate division Zixibacteria bacterium]